MIERPSALAQLARAVGRAPITALLGPRQCGKTTLARTLAAGRSATLFDLESEPDRRRLQNPELVLGALRGLVVLDEIQAGPSSSACCGCWSIVPAARRVPGPGQRLAGPGPARLRVAGRPGRVRGVVGVRLAETGADSWQKLCGCAAGSRVPSWPAPTATAIAWREDFVRTFLERDIPQLGITRPGRRRCAASGRCWRTTTGRPGTRRSWRASSGCRTRRSAAT